MSQAKRFCWSQVAALLAVKAPGTFSMAQQAVEAAVEADMPAQTRLQTLFTSVRLVLLGQKRVVAPATTHSAHREPAAIAKEMVIWAAVAAVAKVALPELAATLPGPAGDFGAAS